MASSTKKAKVNGDGHVRNLAEILRQPTFRNNRRRKFHRISSFSLNFLNSVSSLGSSGGFGGSDVTSSDTSNGDFKRSQLRHSPKEERASAEFEVSSTGQDLPESTAFSREGIISTLLEIQQSIAESLHSTLFGESLFSPESPSLAASLAKSFVLLNILIQRHRSQRDLRNEVTSGSSVNSDAQVATVEPTRKFAEPPQVVDFPPPSGPPRPTPLGGVKAPLEESSSSEDTSSLAGDMGHLLKWSPILRSTLSAPQESHTNTSQLAVPCWVKSNFDFQSQLERVDEECRRIGGRPSVIQGPRSEVNEWDSVPPNIFHTRRFQRVSPIGEEGHSESWRDGRSPLPSEDYDVGSHCGGIEDLFPTSHGLELLNNFPGEMSTFL